MINQPLKRLPALDNVLQFDSRRAVVVKALDVPMPLAPFQRRESVQRGV